MRREATGKHRNRGASLVEVGVGLFVIVPLFLCVIDLSAIVLGQITNDALAKRAARAAAQQMNSGQASAAATAVIQASNGNGIVSSAELVRLDYNVGSEGVVNVQTRVLLTVPAPVPFIPLFQRSREMYAQATQPIVVQLANP